MAGIITRAAATAIYARGKGRATVIPADAWVGGLAAAILIGALAGLLPAIRAARLSPRRRCGPSEHTACRRRSRADQRSSSPLSL